MKNKGFKKIVSLILAICVLLPVFNCDLHADSEREDGLYNVPVFLEHYYEEGKPSMGDGALRRIASASVKDGTVTYTIYTSQMIFSGMEGGLTNLFLYESNDADIVSAGSSPRIEVSKQMIDIGEMNYLPSGEETPFNKAFTFTRNTLDEDVLLLAVWVDAMDKIATPEGKEVVAGSGEQKAKLIIDWDSAELVEKYEAEQEELKQEQDKEEGEQDKEEDEKQDEKNEDVQDEKPSDEDELMSSSVESASFSQFGGYFALIIFKAVFYLILM